MYQIRKRYGHEEGLSCAFRQWRAQETHCRFIHGYPLAFEIVFESETLDERNWVISFGELKELKQWLKDSFDHKTCVARDDPDLDAFEDLDSWGIIQLNVVPDVGCEKFAEMVYQEAQNLLAVKMKKNRVRIVSVTCSEHGGNSAIYIAPVKKDPTQYYVQVNNTAPRPSSEPFWKPLKESFLTENGYFS